MSEDRFIRIPVMARVEGKGALEVTLREGRIGEVRLRIFEPPRLFEKILEGREFREIPDIVARICGICPAAYQITSVLAIEKGFGMVPGEEITRFRRILACGEWISSHSLHIHLLAAPDFLGYPDAMEWGRHDPQTLRRGFELHALGNALMSLLGGRPVHPVGACVGGFFRFPSRQETKALAERIRAALPLASALVRWAADLEYPESDRAFTSVCLQGAGGYPMNEGRIVSDRGHDLDPADFESRIREFQVPHSTAFHSLLDGEPYLVGPLARLNIHGDKIPEDILSDIVSSGIRFPSTNMNHSLLARAIEIHYALREALSLLEGPPPAGPSFIPAEPGERTGIAATEAPRGILWHRYDLSREGLVRKARIIPPTSQNQSMMEDDLRESLERAGLDRPEEALRKDAERIVRNYDPCISCATHFLDLTVHRDDG